MTKSLLQKKINKEIEMVVGNKGVNREQFNELVDKEIKKKQYEEALKTIIQTMERNVIEEVSKHGRL